MLSTRERGKEDRTVDNDEHNEQNGKKEFQIPIISFPASLVTASSNLTSRLLDETKRSRFIFLRAQLFEGR